MNERQGNWYFSIVDFQWHCGTCHKSPARNRDGSGNGYVQSKDQLYEFCPHCGTKMMGANYDDEA